METQLPPPSVLYQIATGHYLSQALHVAAKLGIADHLADGPQSHDALATATGTHAPSLRRVLRLLASAGVLAEREDACRFAQEVPPWERGRPARCPRQPSPFALASSGAPVVQGEQAVAGVVALGSGPRTFHRSPNSGRAARAPRAAGTPATAQPSPQLRVFVQSPLLDQSRDVVGSVMAACRWTWRPWRVGGFRNLVAARTIAVYPV